MLHLAVVAVVTLDADAMFPWNQDAAVQLHPLAAAMLRWIQDADARWDQVADVMVDVHQNRLAVAVSLLATADACPNQLAVAGLQLATVVAATWRSAATVVVTADATQLVAADAV